MELVVLKNDLNSLISKIEGILEIYDTPHPGLSISENNELIRKNYSIFKQHLFQRVEDIQVKERKSDISENEQAFLLPALVEASLELKQKTNSSNMNAIYSCLAEAQSMLNYYVRQISA